MVRVYRWLIRLSPAALRRGVRGRDGRDVRAPVERRTSIGVLDVRAYLRTRARGLDRVAALGAMGHARAAPTAAATNTVEREGGTYGCSRTRDSARDTAIGPEPGVHAGRRVDLGAGHWRKRCDFHRGVSSRLEPAPVPGLGSVDRARLRPSYAKYQLRRQVHELAVLLPARGSRAHAR